MVVDSGFTAMNKDGMGHLQEEEGEGGEERALHSRGGPGRWLVEHHPPVEQYPTAPMAGPEPGGLKVDFCQRAQGSDGPSSKFTLPELPGRPSSV